ncbi:MAG: hypothetical protein OHK0039_25280 [Bacteroidia bacterium]
MSRLHTCYPYIVLTLCTLVGVWLVFGDALFHPNGYLLSHAGDGLRAYYSTAYYARHGGGSWFEGMQYPYGNHVLYVDMNPLLSFGLRLLYPVADLSAYSVGIVNLLVMLAFFPCAWLVYGLLRRSLLPPGYSLLMTIIITFLSPQIIRITGHFSLTYYFYVPLLWYLLLRLFEGRRWVIWLLVYVATVMLASLSHPYYGLLGMSFGWAYALVRAVQEHDLRARAGLYLGLVLGSPLAVVALKVWETATFRGSDDFVRYPYGFLTYIAGFESIFMPLFKPYIDVWNYFIRVRNIDQEGYAYVGLAGLLLLLSWLMRIGQHLLARKGWRVLRPVLPPPLRVAIWAAALLLIPAMALPFQWVPAWSDYAGVLRQFRSLGRLAWFFYYVYMVLSAWYLYALYRNLRIRARGTQLHRIGAFLIFLAVFSWTIDGMVLVHRQKNYFLKHPTHLYHERSTDYRAILADRGYRPEDFQAILSLPFFHMGSEKVDLHDWLAERYAYAVSLSTGLPMCDNFTARSPLQASLETIQLASYPTIPKVLPGKLSDPRPLLLLVSGAPNGPGETLLRDRATPIYQTPELLIASLPLGAFEDTRAAARAAFFQRKDSSLHRRGDLYATYNTPATIFDGYGDRALTPGFSTLAPGDTTILIYDGTIPVVWDNEKVEVSCWVKLDVASNYLPLMRVRIYDGPQQVKKEYYRMQYTRDIWGDWARVSAFFFVPHDTCRIIVDTEARPLQIDNLLIRPELVDVYVTSPEDSLILLNNYPL